MHVLSIVFALVLGSAGNIQAATWQIAPGESIQPIINQAADGDVIELQRGFYRENLRIEKPLTLRGLNRPTLSGGLQGDTVRITAQQVTIEGLIVRDSGGSLRDQNAGIYVQPGAHRITVRTRDLPAGVCVEVEDTGPGVPAELRERIFAPFVTTRPSGAGTGLGLYISRRIAAEHGGTLELLRSSDSGCVFRVELPETART